MQNFYLIRWLRENSVLDPDIIDSLKYELDNRIYFYGKQFRYPFERTRLRHSVDEFKFWAKETIKSCKRASAPIAADGKIKISSNAYHPFNRRLAGNGLLVCPVPWQLGGVKSDDSRLNPLILKIKHVLRFGGFKDLIAADFASDISALRICLRDYFEHENIKALVVPYDMPFFERLAIKVFKDMGKPSIVALHGLPGRYNNIDDSRADYLFVWGDKIKDHYIRAGVTPNKIFATGHPGYSPIPPGVFDLSGKLTFFLNNVLVLSKTMGGSQHSAEEILSDRGNTVLYLYSLRDVLRKNGVKHVKLRLHPSESVEWYRSFLDGDFFRFDRTSLQNSISESSLVIGPASTVFIESLMARVNYLVYEPVLNGRDMANYHLVPPFDGSDPDIPTAHSAEGLQKLLSERKAVNLNMISGYIKSSLDLSPIQGILRKHGGSYKS